MSLTVLCPTRDPGPRVAAILEPLRKVADEILVVANAQTDPDDLAHYASVADRLVRYEFAAPGERLAAYSHAQARGAWVLVIHGDEVASPALIERLPELTAARDVLQYRLPRRWLWPDGAHWLEESPWWPDHQVRLVRNDPATLWFPGLTHTAAALVYPARYLEEPMYHLDLLVRPEDERRRKASEYDAERPGIVAAGGGDQNAVYYGPERHARHAPSRLAEPDRAAIARVLQPRATPAGPVDVGALELWRRTTIDGMWDERPLPESAYHARIEAVERRWELRPGEHRRVFVRVVNLGTETWPWGVRRPEIRLSYRLDGAEGPRSTLPATVAPGGAEVVPLNVVAPARPGRYELEVDLVHEHVRWFGSSARFVLEVG